MMKSGLVALAMIGCDCDAKMCEYIRTVPGEWASVADCEADLQARVVTQHEAWPLVIGVCRASDAPAASTAVADASSIVAPLLAGAPAGEVTTDEAGRITTAFRSFGAYVSVRDTAEGAWSSASNAMSSASRRALDTVAWLRSGMLPDWF